MHHVHTTLSYWILLGKVFYHEMMNVFYLCGSYFWKLDWKEETIFFLYWICIFFFFHICRKVPINLHLAAFTALTFFILSFVSYEFLITMTICSGAMINKERVSAGDQVLLEPEDPTSPLHVGTVVYLYEGSQVSAHRPLVGFVYRTCFTRIPPVLSMWELSSTCTRDHRSGFIDRGSQRDFVYLSWQ